ncbi:sensor histidine kinase [Paenibacillus sp. BC26]|uniref:sensor histidine kinase n=1 Tax=Paenibacillus sp. BC26 TaxID=1881032 RepID=UPI0008E9EA0B|nr:histidine kinase [Paenibacillus sp. BC26]SFT24296.1 Histidine kinase-, DNA gyrase B-, and HSP90-like ATPase [Paenibacillus sp. BC26]
MKPAAQHSKYLSVGKKLFLSYLILLLIPVLAIGYYAYTSSVRSGEEQTSAAVSGTLSQIHDNIAYRMEDIKHISDELYLDQTMQNNLSKYEEGYYSYENMSRYLQPKLTNMLSSMVSNVWLDIYTDNPTVPEVFFARGSEVDPLSAGRDFEIMHMDRLRMLEWYKQLDFPQEIYGQTFVWQQVDNDARFGNISLMRRLINFDEGSKPFGFMRIVTKISDLLQAVDYRKITDKSVLVVSDWDGNTLFTSAPSSLDATWDSKAAGDEYFVITKPVAGLNWKLSAYIPRSYLKENAVSVRNVYIMMCIMVVAVLILISALFSRYFIRKMTKIIAAIDSFREGDFSKRIHFKSRDEFAQIGDAFNNMGRNMEEMIQNLYVANLQKKEAELEFLQAQINPHFLYNTLSSISRLAKFGQNDKLQKTVFGLAKFYRLSLNDGRILTSITNEVEHCKVYTELQQAKYENRLRVCYEIDKEVLSYTTVKLILQPFIENTLKHAWYGDQINIRITAQKEEQHIAFRIIDDGVGIRPDLLEQIMNPRGVQVGYGIRNVDSRIKLQFGDAYGVSLYSRPGIGTSVTIRIPFYQDPAIMLGA